MSLAITGRKALLFVVVIVTTVASVFFHCSPLAAQTTPPKNDELSRQLREAAGRGDLEGVQDALEKGADIDAASDYGVTALALACDHGHEAIVRELISRKANPNTTDRFYRFTPLGWAVMKNRPAIVELLVQGGAENIDSTLEIATSLKNPETVAKLIASKKASEKALIASLRIAKESKSQELIDLISKELSPEAIESADVKTPEPAPSETLKEYLGRYRNSSGSIIVLALNGNAIEVKEPDQERGTAVTLSEKDLLTSRGVTIQAVRENGAITSLKVTIGERETVYTKLSDSESTPSAPEKSKAKLQLSQDFPLENENWPSFRGQLSRGIGASASGGGSEIATEWDGETAKNIEWKFPVPGLGTSSPIVWGNRLFLTTAVSESDTSGFRVGAYGDVESVASEGECQFLLLCIDIESGKPIWQKELNRAVPKVKRHAKSSHANPTPATDGKYVIASFGGEGIYCVDFDGDVLWNRDLGTLDSGWFYDRSYQWGFGSSPCIFEDLVILQCDCQDGSFITALDLKTGEQRWRTGREEIPTWGTPVAYVAPDGRPTVVASGTRCAAAYDARTGEQLWKMGGFSEIVVPTPQVTPDLTILSSGYAPVRPIVALLHSARGDLVIPEDGKAEAPFAWSVSRAGPYMPTPIVSKNKLLVLDNSGVFSCYALEDGTRTFRQRMRAEGADAYTASPVISGDKVYLVSEIGLTFVVSADRDGEVIAKNSLGESVLATPAIAQGRLFIRGEKHLFSIKNK